jgi:hypothetical protein
MAYGDKLERVEVFKYLGWLLAYDDNDTQAMQGNLKKARKSWGQVSCVLRAENASPKVCGVFYKATVQAVLLFESEMWKLSTSSLKSLEGFHIRAARCMAGKMPTRNPDGTWAYPSSKDVLKAVGLRMSTIILVFVRKPSSTSSWTDLYLRSVGKGKERGDWCVAHFGGSNLCQSTVRSHYQGTTKTKVTIPNFAGDNLFGVSYLYG